MAPLRTASPLPSFADGYVWVIEVRALQSTPLGAGFSEWEDLTPGKRYTPIEIDEFESELDLSDFVGMQWRARVHDQWHAPQYVRRLEWMGNVDRPVHRSERLAPGECLPPPSWDWMVHALAH